MSVAELVVVAKALKVPAILLLFPVGRQKDLEILPGLEVDAWESLKWFTGEQAFTEQDPSTLGWVVEQTDQETWRTSTAPLDSYRLHEECVIDLKNTLRRAQFQRKVAREAANSEDRDAGLERAEQDEARSRTLEKQLSHIRTEMRRLDITPPRLESSLAFIDEPAT